MMFYNIFSAVYNLLYNEDPLDVLYPQSQEMPVHPRAEIDGYQHSEASEMTKQQNVQFVDTHPGEMEEKVGYTDMIRDAPMATDATLDEFFSRPIKIVSAGWGVGATFYQSFNPWQLYFQNLRVINRVANYKLMSCKLHVKFVLNGTPFHYGRLIASYNPLPTFDNMTVDRAFIPQDVVEASQRPHVYLNPTCSIGSEMKLPFFLHRNLIDIVSEDWKDMGEMVLHSMQLLKHANGATDIVTVNVFAWAEEVRLAIPTQFEPGSIAPQSDEYSMRTVSRTATAVSNLAANLSNVPVIGPWARATQIGAGAMAMIAQAFGFSKPAILDTSVFKPTTSASMAVTNDQADVQKLSIDAKQELCIDPRTTGLDNSDEMAILNIAMRESYITKFTWSVARVSEELLYNMVVDPGVYDQIDAEIHLPACSFAVQPFKFWRGTLRYRFQIVCSNLHKGRLKFVYDPTGTITGAAEYNTAYTTIVDISDHTDFTIDIGWGQRTTYREHYKAGGVLPSAFMSTSRLAYTTPAQSQGNGTLSIYVVNNLTVPNTAIDNDIQINVFVSALNDFEVAVPDSSVIRNLRLTQKMGLVSSFAAIAPQAESMDPGDSVPSEPPNIARMAVSVSADDQTQLLHFGERITSMRQMLKRFDFHEFIRAGGFAANVRARSEIIRNAFPFYPGYTLFGGNLALTYQAEKYLYSNMTMMNYVTCAYAGWRGSVRYMINYNDVAANSDRSTCEVVRRDAIAPITQYANMSANPNTPQGQAQRLNSMQNFSPSYEGESLQVSKVNTMQCIEVPYYSRYRFTPAKMRDEPALASELMPCFSIALSYYTVASDTTATIQTYVAGGEDFTCFFYLGPPIFYREDVVPGA